MMGVSPPSWADMVWMDIKSQHDGLILGLQLLFPSFLFCKLLLLLFYFALTLICDQ